MKIYRNKHRSSADSAERNGEALASAAPMRMYSDAEIAAWQKADAFTPGERDALDKKLHKLTSGKKPGEAREGDPFRTFGEWDGEADRHAYAER